MFDLKCNKLMYVNNHPIKEKYIFFMNHPDPFVFYIHKSNYKIKTIFKKLLCLVNNSFISC